MKIGYLHIGPPEHGVCRYGRLLATEAHRRSELKVIEANVILSEDRKHNQRMLIEAAFQLSQADVIHFQFNKFNKLLWGGGWLQLNYLRVFMDNCSCPLVVTLHDVFYPPYGLTSTLKYLYSKLQKTTFLNKDAKVLPSNEPSQPKRSILTKAFGFTQSTFQEMFGSDALALREIANRVNLMLVCTQEEAQRLCDRVDKRKLKVVPHFVEARSIKMSRAEARAALGLNGVKVVTLLGFIYPPKGHQIMIEAMPKLPQDITVVFAGSPSVGYKHLVHDFLALAKAKGVDRRLRITGYLLEEELESYLLATDLAVCPFSRFSASGSISTWISVARPILASDFPQVAEYNRFELDAIKTFQPYTPDALAEAIRHLLPMCRENEDSTVAKLRQKLSMPAIFDKHLIQYSNLKSFGKIEKSSISKILSL
ncbi:MAG: glycosyltransferase [Scytonema sp. PMC 1069.18]|nr:glycosyltransferase [Scytonema sp. PMC 1069.18]MEC4882333.1 glycosyltransferase [Scytonema sp. PMC 1070.18]